MIIIDVPTGVPYKVYCERGLLSRCGEMICNTTKAKKCCIVSDDTVYALYGEALTKSLQAAGCETTAFVFPHGEASKSHETLLRLYDALCAADITRADALIALGGGVTGDLTGYAAATYLRGLRYVQIPTTLLAQVDSSVGGKTAVNLPAGKNLVGAFHQPACVICDSDTLKTLPDAELSCGMAEVVKYGMIRDAALFDRLAACDLAHLPQLLDEVIPRCIAIKRDVVATDEFDTGERMLLNFGHTIGHAIERYTDFAWTHGQAVAAGMCLISQHTAPPDVTKALTDCLARYDLPIDGPCPLDQLLPLCAHDKKRAGAGLTWIVCEAIGRGTLVSGDYHAFCDKMNR